MCGVWTFEYSSCWQNLALICFIFLRYNFLYKKALVLIPTLYLSQRISNPASLSWNYHNDIISTFESPGLVRLSNPVDQSITKCQPSHISSSLILPVLGIFSPVDWIRILPSSQHIHLCSPPPALRVWRNLPLLLTIRRLLLSTAVSYLFQIRPFCKSNLVSFFCMWTFWNLRAP